MVRFLPGERRGAVQACRRERAARKRAGTKTSDGHRKRSSNGSIRNRIGAEPSQIRAGAGATTAGSASQG